MTPKKYSERKREERLSAKSETLGVILIIVSAFFLACLITRGLILGAVGSAIAHVLLGFAGLSTYALFLFTLLLGILKVKKCTLAVKRKYVAGIIVIALAVVLIANLATSSAYMGGGFKAYLSAVYKAKNTVGGVLFGLVNYLFYAIFKTVFSYILFSLAIVVTLFFMSGFYAGLPMNSHKSVKSKSQKASRNGGGAYERNGAFASTSSGGLFVGTIERAGGRYSQSSSFDGIDERSESDFSDASEEIKDKIYNYEKAKKLLFTENKVAFEQFLPKTQVAEPIQPVQEEKEPEKPSIPEIAMPAPKDFEHKYVAGVIINGDNVAGKLAEEEPVESTEPAPTVDEAKPFAPYVSELEQTAKKEESKPYFNPAPIINGDFYESGKEITYTTPYSAPVEEDDNADVVDGVDTLVKSETFGGSEDDLPRFVDPDDYNPNNFEPEPEIEEAKNDEPVAEAQESEFVSSYEEPVDSMPESIEVSVESHSEESFEDDESEPLVGAIEGGSDDVVEFETPTVESEKNEQIEDNNDGSIIDEGELTVESEPSESTFIGSYAKEPKSEKTSEMTEEEMRSATFETTTESFTFTDEVEDLTQKNYKNPDDTTGYYNPVSAPIAPPVKPSFEQNVSTIDVKINPKPDQIDIGTYAKHSADKKAEEQPKPAPKPVKPKKYVPPPLDLLTTESGKPEENSEESQNKIMLLENVLEEMGVPAKVTGVTVGPSVTRYELDMPPGISVKKVETLSADIRYNLASKGKIRIETPIPGKRAVGIELPNDVIQIVALKDIIASKEFRASTSPLTIALGKDIQGNVMLTRLDKLPHVLVAGATGSGKSSCLNSLLISLLYKASPQDVRLILIDPKRVEFTAYNGLPHMMVPNAITDVNQAVNAFKWAYDEMERRYVTLQQYQVRNIGEYNDLPEVKEGTLTKMPFIIVIVDELANLITSSKSTRKTLEDIIMAIASKARAAGIHLVLATQRPSVDVITGTIKANLPSRIAFAVTSIADSRTILDNAGAELLLGRGDMLFAPVDASEETRIQGAYVENLEVKNIVNFVKEHNQCDFDGEFENAIAAKEQSSSNGSSDASPDENNPYDEELIDVARCVIKTGQASTSMIQRRFRFGWNKAARIMDQLSELNFIGPPDGAKPREVLATKETFEAFFGEDL